MKRLTKMDGMGEQEIIRCFGCGSETAGGMNETCGMCSHWYEAVRKLAAYEDTGLMPEEIVKLKDFINSQCAKLLAENTELKARLENAETSNAETARCKVCGDKDTEDCPMYFGVSR